MELVKISLFSNINKYILKLSVGNTVLKSYWVFNTLSLQDHNYKQYLRVYYIRVASYNLVEINKDSPGFVITNFYCPLDVFGCHIYTNLSALENHL